MRQQTEFHDPELIMREYYNPNKFNVTFTLDKTKITYLMKTGKYRRLDEYPYILKPDQHILLPHGYFIVTGENHELGEPVHLLMNVGNEMGKGNKKASQIGIINKKDAISDYFKKDLV